MERGEVIRRKIKSWRPCLGKYGYALTAAALGILLLLLPTDKKEAEPPDVQDPFDRMALQREMEDILGAVDGAGALRVMLSVDSGSALELAEDVAAESESRKTQTVVLGAGSGKQEIVVTRSVYPRITGALVVCEGAGSAAVRLDISQAVGALTGLSADKISVIKGKPSY